MASSKTVLNMAAYDSRRALGCNRIALASQGSFVAIWAAVSWVLLGIESIVRPRQVNFRDVVWIIPFSLTTAAFVYLHLVQRSRESKVETIGFYAVIIASLLAFLGNVGVQLDAPMLAKFGFPWGALLWMAGLIVFGIGTWIAKVLPWYVGLALILLEPGALLTGLALAPVAPLHDRGAYSAGIEKGFVLAVVALALSQLKNKRE
ncbi:MAG TPA: hypothetical protein VIW67_08530, partial [Terriglobales bacterium]